MRTRSTVYNSVNARAIKSLLIGIFFGIIFCAGLLALLAFLFTKNGSIPHVVVGPVVVTLAGLGAFLGGYISSRIMKEKGMMYGTYADF